MRNEQQSVTLDAVNSEDDVPLEANGLTNYLDDETVDLPLLLETAKAAETIASVFLQVDGATFNLYFGNMAGSPYFAVSIYLDQEAKHSKWWNGKSLSVFKLKTFITSNRELLKEPRNSIGVWYDAENDRTYLEVTATLPFRDKADYTEAVRQGRHYNQVGIYDLEEKAYIALGGTGELPEDVPPVLERLSTLQRGRVL